MAELVFQSDNMSYKQFYLLTFIETIDVFGFVHTTLLCAFSIPYYTLFVSSSCPFLLIGLSLRLNELLFPIFHSLVTALYIRTFDMTSWWLALGWSV